MTPDDGDTGCTVVFRIRRWLLALRDDKGVAVEAEAHPIIAPPDLAVSHAAGIHRALPVADRDRLVLAFCKLSAVERFLVRGPRCRACQIFGG